MKSTAVIVVIAAMLAGTAPATLAEGASGDYGKTYCSYYKNRAMAAASPERRNKLLAEYKRCLKERGER